MMTSTKASEADFLCFCVAGSGADTSCMRAPSTPVRISKLSLVFFFSSRRRHTRCSRDWSSDVCSSDLEIKAAAIDLVAEAALRRGAEVVFAENEVVSSDLDDLIQRLVPAGARA